MLVDVNLNSIVGYYPGEVMIRRMKIEQRTFYDNWKYIERIPISKEDRKRVKVIKHPINKKLWNKVFDIIPLRQVAAFWRPVLHIPCPCKRTYPHHLTKWHFIFHPGYSTWKKWFGGRSLRSALLLIQKHYKVAKWIIDRIIKPAELLTKDPTLDLDPVWEEDLRKRDKNLYTQQLYDDMMKEIKKVKIPLFRKKEEVLKEEWEIRIVEVSRKAQEMELNWADEDSLNNS